MADPGVIWGSTFFLVTLNPRIWAGLGVGLAMGMSGIGAAWGFAIIGTSMLGASVRVPRISSKHLISIIFCEAVAIFGIISGLVILSRIGNNVVEPPTPTDFKSSYILFASGVTAGICGIVSGLSVGVVGSGCALADAMNGSLFVKLLVIEIFASALALFGLISAMLLTTKASVDM
eukprot:TRINITY_DN2810_c0_g1_i1.p1 TRINITY_DN2810_c0_g1~~TRINITY_DN2810_c0_g1_i1.p1  ORF type:complete len:176 (+),score=23.61 TRINITY_DN2810_c0_g1_i1:233-760(+)